MRRLETAGSIAEAFRTMLGTLGGCLSWDAAELWVPDKSRDGGCGVEPPLTRSACWCRHGNNPCVLDEGGDGSGVPARVWRTRKPVWITYAGLEPGLCPRIQQARDLGLESACAVPVSVRNVRMVGVLLLLARDPHPPDIDLLECVSSLGRALAEWTCLDSAGGWGERLSAVQRALARCRCALG